jgi:hypothetical protein
LCAPGDLTDAKWALIAPLIRPAKRAGRPRTVDVREVLNAIRYVLSADGQWMALSKDLPRRSTARAPYFDLRGWDGTLACIHHVFQVPVPERGISIPELPRRARMAESGLSFIEFYRCKVAIFAGAVLQNTLRQRPARPGRWSGLPNRTGQLLCRNCYNRPVVKIS